MIQQLTCPICEAALPAQSSSEVPTFPFCSERCRNVDLFRWWDGRYSIVESIDDRPDKEDLKQATDQNE